MYFVVLIASDIRLVDLELQRLGALEDEFDVEVEQIGQPVVQRLFDRFALRLEPSIARFAKPTWGRAFVADGSGFRRECQGSREASRSCAALEAAFDSGLRTPD